jgi:hypothetical protein
MPDKPPQEEWHLPPPLERAMPKRRPLWVWIVGAALGVIVLAAIVLLLIVLWVTTIRRPGLGL